MNCSFNRFSFVSNSGTNLNVYMLKEIIAYYNINKTNLYTYFLGAFKAYRNIKYSHQFNIPSKEIPHNT